MGTMVWKELEGSKEVDGVKNIYSTDSTASEEEASLVCSSNRKLWEKFRDLAAQFRVE